MTAPVDTLSPIRDAERPPSPAYDGGWLAPGARVFARDGHLLGTVIETSPSCFRLSRLGIYRYWLTRELVRYADHDHVWLHTHGSIVARYRHRRCDSILC